MSDIKIREVNPSHERTDKGVRFNIETLSELGPLKDTIDIDADRFVNDFYNDRNFKAKVEVSSFKREQVVSPTKGFVHVALEAFNRHYPLVIRPDDIWLLLTWSFSKHVENNAEALRKNFVQHEGKKALIVDVSFGPGQTQPEDWERSVFPSFSRQIREHIGEHTHSIIAGSFSTTTITDKAAHEITLMAAMKQYFSYYGRTDCGIPFIELHGTEKDWIDVRDRAKQLSSLMISEEGERWMSYLGPVLDEFVASYQGNVNHHFWQGMVKKIRHGYGSGSYSTVSGWITLFYLSLSNHHKSWQKMISSDGPEPSEFPPVVSSAPVVWDYLGTNIPIHFHAGYYAIKQDEKTLALQSCIGWAVSHDPPNGEKRIIALEKEIELLKKGQTDNDYSTKYAISNMEKELEKLKSKGN
eukprot:TRINITY_DN102_c0_g1_i2.p1 TRINITY_DN102_c0_g1~~TRINITY_DN102_c0_g1_i2.p1  ORF type:complete len:438 (-),score=70.35 TRINITY_DN102_c0_g1_i2:315-1550(-)